MAGRLAAAAALAAVACLLGAWAPNPSESVRYPCFGRAVTIGATDGDDVIYGTPDDDVINALKGDDKIWGRGGNDRVCGGYGDDRVYGNTARDRVKGGPGRDHVRGGRSIDFVIVFDYRLGNDIADGGDGEHDACSIDAGFEDRPGDVYTDGCEDVVGAPAGGVIHR
jgi:Ca2+-binding RTX toxin-like protein